MGEGFGFPKVKICGLSRVDEVQAAVMAGAEAVGFVHYKSSPRNVEAEVVAAVTAILPPDVLPVAVMVNPRVDEASEWMERSKTRVLQLCGNEKPSAWRAFPYPILRRVAVDDRAMGEIERWGDFAMGFVLDHPSKPGGTGKKVDLKLATEVAREAPCLLAGGLDEENVAERIHAVWPIGVDASSRLEIEPGRKDVARVKLFVERALAAFEEGH